MSYQTKIWLGQKFFAHLTPQCQLLAVEAALAKRLGLRQSSGAFPTLPNPKSARGLAHSIP